MICFVTFVMSMAEQSLEQHGYRILFAIAVYRIVKCELAFTCKVRSSLRIIAWTSNKPQAPMLCGNDPPLSVDHRSHARNITVGMIESTLQAVY